MQLCRCGCRLVLTRPVLPLVLSAQFLKAAETLGCHTHTPWPLTHTVSRKRHVGEDDPPFTHQTGRAAQLVCIVCVYEQELVVMNPGRRWRRTHQKTFFIPAKPEITVNYISCIYNPGYCLKLHPRRPTSVTCRVFQTVFAAAWFWIITLILQVLHH